MHSQNGIKILSIYCSKAESIHKQLNRFIALIFFFFPEVADKNSNG